jgi:hypothetical protein
MKAPGKLVVDEFYVHLSALSEVQNSDVVTAVRRLDGLLPRSEAPQPNVAKVNLRTWRVSLLAYPAFFDEPFPELAAAWTFQPGATAPSSFRLGLFDDTSTIGFRLNWERLIASKGYRLVEDEFVPLGNDDSIDAGSALLDPELPVQRHLTALSRTALSAPIQLLIRHGLLSPGQSLFDYGCGRGGDIAGLLAEGYDAKGWDPHFAPESPRLQADLVNLGFVINVIEDPAERIEALHGAFKC